jgi:hypothetical protein
METNQYQHHAGAAFNRLGLQAAVGRDVSFVIEIKSYKGWNRERSRSLVRKIIEAGALNVCPREESKAALSGEPPLP